jgi:hypothetical protein
MLTDQARTEAARTRESVEAEASQIRELARAEAATIGDRARSEATKRVAGAKEAADEALAEARAVSSGLRQLGESLTAQAERILRDVQTAHRQITSDLRVATERSRTGVGADGSSRGADDRSPSRSSSGRSAGGDRRESPFDDDIDLPSWVER